MPTLTPKIRTGLPTLTKQNPRADFEPKEFDKLIQTHGYRVYWSRAGLCPCTNPHAETLQPDINCSLCKGDAYYYFLPDPAIRTGATLDDAGNPVNVSPDGKGLEISGIMTNMTKDPQVFEKLGTWVMGMSMFTTEPGNKIGYRDRLVALDSEIVWNQTIVADGTDTIGLAGKQHLLTGLRYPLVSVHEVRTIQTIFTEGTDFLVTPAGTIQWLSTPPSPNTRIAIHGTVHPSWVVLDHPHTYRDTQIYDVTKARQQRHQPLPVQVAVKLDFLVAD